MERKDLFEKTKKNKLIIQIPDIPSFKGLEEEEIKQVLLKGKKGSSSLQNTKN